jgi:hypothetical protein
LLKIITKLEKNKTAHRVATRIDAIPLIEKEKD